MCGHPCLPVHHACLAERLADAFFLAFKHQDTFDAVSSISGGVDLTYSTVKWEISKKIGSYEKFLEWWRDNPRVGGSIPSSATLICRRRTPRFAGFFVYSTILQIGQ